jgi:hypothetical protein
LLKHNLIREDSGNSSAISRDSFQQSSNPQQTKGTPLSIHQLLVHNYGAGVDYSGISALPRP